ncbi:DMT family transporter [Alcaligenaceae bacterium CGII-47]|nr:DMT family transporter [Alcaligenaceae bacterium CGII-47]
MSFPAVFLPITTFVLAIYLGALVVEHVTALNQRKHLSTWAEAVLAAVQEHITELEHNRTILIKDQGYGISDDSQWKEEIIGFVRLILINKHQMRFKTPQAESEFIGFAAELIEELLAQPGPILGFSIPKHLESLETVSKRWRLSQPILRWGFAVIYLIIASQFLISQVWVAAVSAALAGLVLLPFAQDRITLAAPRLARFRFGWLSALVLAVLAQTAVTAHTERQRIAYEAVAAEQQHEAQLLADRKEQEQQEAAAQKREQEEESVRQSFAAESEQVLGRLAAAIQDEQFADAKAIIDKFSLIDDDSLTQLEGHYKTQKAAYDKRIAEENALRQRQENYEQRIPDYAIDKYTHQEYPKLVTKYRSRLPEIEKLRRTAAEMAIDSGKCDYAENVQLSGESTLKSLKIFLDCKNGSRIYLTEAEIKNHEPVKTQKENALDHSEAISQCRSMVRAHASARSQTMIPSSIDFHSILGTSVRTAPTLGNVIVSIDFDAKNVFNAEVGYTARCIFPPKQPGEIKVFIRRD